MEFFIKKGATLPLLKLNIVNNGRNDYDRFLNTLELSSLFFSMTNVDTGIPKIVNKPAGIGGVSPNYFIYYQFQNSDTLREGRFEAEFVLKNSDGTLILNLGEKLFINILDSFVTDDLTYESCYVIDFACCYNEQPSVIYEPTPTPTLTYTPSQTLTPTPTITYTPSQTLTPTPTPSVTISNTPTLTPSLTPTLTITPSSTANSVPITLGYDAIDCAVSCNGYYVSGQTFYISPSVVLPLNTGNQIYTDSSLTTLGGLGYYSDGVSCFEYCDNLGVVEICSITSCG